MYLTVTLDLINALGSATDFLLRFLEFKSKSSWFFRFISTEKKCIKIQMIAREAEQ